MVQANGAAESVHTAWGTLQRMGENAMTMLPRVGVAVVVFILFLLLGRGVQAITHRITSGEGNRYPNLALAMSRLANAVVVVLGFFLAVTVAFPSFTASDLFTVLGVGGVAIGFAFKDIFQNFLAGLLILITRPFHVGDQIIFKSFEGTVEDIQTRATLIKTYDGRRVVIPNGDIFTNPVTVNTAFAQRRMQYDIGIGYGDDIDKARGIILGVLEQSDDVLPDPKADVIVVDLAGSSVNLRARWWSQSHMADVLLAQDRVLTAVKRELTAHGIDLPFPTRQVLFHDQTEATDGDRRAQREGWPAGKGDVPASRSIGGAIASAAGSVRQGVPADQERHPEREQ